MAIGFTITDTEEDSQSTSELSSHGAIERPVADILESPPQRLNGNSRVALRNVLHGASPKAGIR